MSIDDYLRLLQATVCEREDKKKSNNLTIWTINYSEWRTNRRDQWAHMHPRFGGILCVCACDYVWPYVFTNVCVCHSVSSSNNNGSSDNSKTIPDNTAYQRQLNSRYHTMWLISCAIPSVRLCVIHTVRAIPQKKKKNKIKCWRCTSGNGNAWFYRYRHPERTNTYIYGLDRLCGEQHTEHTYIYRPQDGPKSKSKQTIMFASNILTVCCRCRCRCRCFRLSLIVFLCCFCCFFFRCDCFTFHLDCVRRRARQYAWCVNHATRINGTQRV